MRNNSVIKTVGVSLLALVLALLTPLTLVFSLQLLLIPLILVWLYAWAGTVPAALYTAGTLFMCALTGGTGLAVLAAFALFVPPCLTIVMIRLRKSYDTCLKVSIISQTLALMLSVIILWMVTGRSAVDLFMDFFAERLREIPSAFTEQMFLVYGQLGLFAGGANGIDFAKGYLTSQEYLQVIDMFCATTGDGLKTLLPALILTNGITSGLIDVALPVWIYANRGDDLGSRRLPMSEWHVPRNAAIGLPVCLILSYIMYRTGMASGYAVFEAIKELCLLLLSIQGAGSLSRSLKRSGSSRAKRIILISLLLLFARLASYIIGFCSLYLGSQGIITSYLKKKVDNGNNNGEDR